MKFEPPSPSRGSGERSRSNSPSRLAKASARGRSPAPLRAYSPDPDRPEPPSPHREPPPPEAKPQRPAVKGSGAVKNVFKSGLTFASATKAAAAPFKAAWAAAASGFRLASAMLRDVIPPQRPVVRLAVAPIGAALIRTLVVAVIIPPQGPVRFLAPTMPDCLLGHTSRASEPRRAALVVARDILSLLPIPSLLPAASPLLIPAFERVPASGDLVQTVDRIVAVPLFSASPPSFSDQHDGWLHWITLAAASSLVYVMVAHAVNRVRTYRATMPRHVLDSLMAASPRLRSGALELRRLGPVGSKRKLDSDVVLRHGPAPAERQSVAFAQALAKSLAVDQHRDKWGFFPKVVGFFPIRILVHFVAF